MPGTESGSESDSESEAHKVEVVTLEWEEGKDEQQIQLCDIQSDGRGRLKWEAVERAFGAANVELALGGPPSLCQGTQRKGLTKGLFKPGSTIPVVVFGKEQGVRAVERWSWTIEMPEGLGDIHEEATQIPQLAEIRATVEEHIPDSLQTWNYQLKSQLRKPKPASSTDTVSDKVMYMDIYDDKNIEWAFTTTPANTNGICHVQFRVIYEPKDFTSFSTTEEGMQAILRDAYTWKIPQHQFGGIMVPVPLCTYTESDMKMALPQDYNIYYERKNHTVEDLIHHAVAGICYYTPISSILGEMDAAHLEQICVHTILGTAVLITASLLGLEKNQLRLVPNVNISGALAQGCVNYLLKGQSLQGSLVVMTTEEWTVSKEEFRGQMLAQISALSDNAKEITEHACGQADTPSLKPKHDVFGVLTNGKDWQIYRFQPGSSDVIYECHQLSTFMGIDSESYAGQIEEILSAIVGIMTYVVRGTASGCCGNRLLPEGVVRSPKRKRDVEECDIGPECPEHRHAAQRPKLPETPCQVSNSGSHATEEASRQPEPALAGTMLI